MCACRLFWAAANVDTTTDADTGGSNRLPVGNRLQVFVFQYLESGICGGVQPAVLAVVEAQGTAAQIQQAGGTQAKG